MHDFIHLLLLIKLSLINFNLKLQFCAQASFSLLLILLGEEDDAVVFDSLQNAACCCRILSHDIMKTGDSRSDARSSEPGRCQTRTERDIDTHPMMSNPCKYMSKR